MLVFVRPNLSYVRPKLKVIGQLSCQVKYLFAALLVHYPIFLKQTVIIIYSPVLPPPPKLYVESAVRESALRKKQTAPGKNKLSPRKFATTGKSNQQKQRNPIRSDTSESRSRSRSPLLPKSLIRPLSGSQSRSRLPGRSPTPPSMRQSSRSPTPPSMRQSPRSPITPRSMRQSPKSPTPPSRRQSRRSPTPPQGHHADRQHFKETITQIADATFKEAIMQIADATFKETSTQIANAIVEIV